ncbi:hypothetical protein [Rhodococcus sp. 11-3]|uniref:hypothetical protein n=1 Tax=Rhodococcus sp. 11-3 TaxID=2854796 RepID=UPI00203B3484|nr:hypothetical protein [Rhodococcus sp. 11-3]USC17070.1 hypothetical protein KZJ41_09460 [Rhodococcus sp. 11-3]
MEREDIIQLARENGLRFTDSRHNRLITPNDRWEVRKILDEDRWLVFDQQGHTPRADVSGLIEAQEHIDRVVFDEEGS